MTSAAADEEDKPIDGRQMTRHQHRFGGKRSMAGLLNLARHFGRRASRRKSSLLSLFFTSLLVVPAILYIVLAYMVAGDPRLLPLAIRDARSVLLVVAHPDDECLFFGPSILNAWGDRRVGRALLVLSSGWFFFFLDHSYLNNVNRTKILPGDYDGLGEVRRKEVKGSCDTLGVSTDRCVVLEHRDMQDNPKKWWSEAVVEGMLKRYVDSWHIDLVSEDPAIK
jgi:N-acetylglucosaminylphosphatidylinositol deacetylase